MGPFTEIVRTNLRRIRDEQGLSLHALSDRLRTVGHPLVPSGIGRIEQGERRVDVDDLLALSVALGVSPLQLLLPPERRRDSRVYLTPNADAATSAAWAWALGTARVSSGDELPWGLTKVHIPDDGYNDLLDEIDQLARSLDTIARGAQHARAFLRMYQVTLDGSIERLEDRVDREEAALRARADTGYSPGVTEFPRGRRDIEEALKEAHRLLDQAKPLLRELEAQLATENGGQTEIQWGETNRG